MQTQLHKFFWCIFGLTLLILHFLLIHRSDVDLSTLSQLLTDYYAS